MTKRPVAAAGGRRAIAFDSASDPHELDPGVIRAAQVIRDLGLASLAPDIVGLQAARRSANALGAFLCEGEPLLAGEATVKLAGPHGPLECRVFPSGENAPTLVYFHGGGFAMGEARGWDGLMRCIARSSDVTVISVDYRRSPEHRFPVAFDEACFAIDFVQTNPEAFGIDPKRVAAGGDSAGANLALAAACALKEAAGPPLAMLLLFYGVYSPDMQSPSWRRLGGGNAGLSQQTMEWIWDNYFASAEQRRDWRAAPLAAPLRGLPHTYLCVGTMDPLVDDNYQLQERLSAAGVGHVLRIWPGLNHGFVRLNELVPLAARAVEEATNALCVRLHSSNQVAETEPLQILR